MSITVRLVVSGAKRLQNDLEVTAKGMNDLRGFFRDILSPLLTIEYDKYATREAGPEGPWAPLAQSTIEDRLRKGFLAGPILWRTGDGFMSLIDPTSPGGFESISAQSYMRGTDREYMYLHESGTGTMPARRWSPGDKFWKMVEEELADYVVKPLKGKR
jgi:hypothetical protein